MDFSVISLCESDDPCWIIWLVLWEMGMAFTIAMAGISRACEQTLSVRLLPSILSGSREGEVAFRRDLSGDWGTAFFQRHVEIVFRYKWSNCLQKRIDCWRLQNCEKSLRLLWVAQWKGNALLPGKSMLQICGIGARGPSLPWGKFGFILTNKQGESSIDFVTRWLDWKKQCTLWAQLIE